MSIIQGTVKNIANVDEQSETSASHRHDGCARVGHRCCLLVDSSIVGRVIEENVSVTRGEDAEWIAGCQAKVSRRHTLACPPHMDATGLSIGHINSVVRVDEHPARVSTDDAARGKSNAIAHPRGISIELRPLVGDR